MILIIYIEQLRFLLKRQRIRFHREPPMQTQLELIQNPSGSREQAHCLLTGPLESILFCCYFSKNCRLCGGQNDKNLNLTSLFKLNFGVCLDFCFCLRITFDDKRKERRYASVKTSSSDKKMSPLTHQLFFLDCYCVCKTKVQIIT